jgi:hypothetical protein
MGGKTTSVEEDRSKRRGRPRGTYKEGASVRAIHITLNNNHDKAGQCELCAKQRKTDLAFMLHPRPYTRDRRDYRELCRSCHKKLDALITRLLPLDPQTYLIPHIAWADQRSTD